MTASARVGRAAFLLGFAGLLPPFACVAALLLARTAPESALGALGVPALVIGIAYPLVILSFLGGMWWGLAMTGERAQWARVGVAVVPSLAALALVGAAAATEPNLGWLLVAIGSAVLLTLPVDRALVRRGEAPANWMRLRVPLSVGLGAATILLGVLVGGPVSRF